MEEFPKANNEEGGMEEKMIECVKISTVFDNAKVLESIADNLMSQGLISGFSIESVKAGYVYGGKMVEEDQFKLEILLDSESDNEKKRKIISKINEVIRTRWGVPAIQEQNVVVNEKFLSFIKRAEVEHKRYRKERKLKLTIALATLMSVSGLFGTVTKKYIDNKKEEAVAAERTKTYNRLGNLQQKMQEKIIALESQIAKEEPLHEAPTDMAAFAGYEETREILDLVRDAEFESMKLADPERFKK